MIRRSLIGLTFAVLALGGCDDSVDRLLPVEHYTVTLTSVELVKKASHETLPVEGLPVEGATLVEYPPD